MLIESMLSMDPYKRPKIDDIRVRCYNYGNVSKQPAILTAKSDSNQAKISHKLSVWKMNRIFGITIYLLFDGMKNVTLSVSCGNSMPYLPFL